jgi:hypothetical protein
MSSALTSRAFALFLPSLMLAACGGSQPVVRPPAEPEPLPPSATPQAQAVDSGKECAKAEARCGSGICNVTVKNDCDARVHCELTVTATCDTAGAATEVYGGDRASIDAHASGEVDAQATCSTGQTLHTEVRKLTCR